MQTSEGHSKHESLGLCTGYIGLLYRDYIGVILGLYSPHLQIKKTFFSYF